ncbi:MAG: hypothetical protein LC104_06885, partial [Bacteroidales bacterium]|nr:hypothetical protein [Bacteroidales bacterium]
MNIGKLRRFLQPAQGFCMEFVEIRDQTLARNYILQGLWFARAVPLTPVSVRATLEWCFEVASGGHALPPIAFVADVGGLVFGTDRSSLERHSSRVTEWLPTLIRSYEDHVLGKLYADWTFERATDAIRRYSGYERVKGLAYTIQQIRQRSGFGGVELAPAIIRGLLQSSGENLLADGYESLTRDGPHPVFQQQLEHLIQAFRKSAEVLGIEDLIALEQRTALADMGQYVAHRQILTTTARIEAELPTRPVRPLAGRKEVPTRIHDEDQYPVGGYSSIATRGSIESLLHSQLAYMEPQES